MIEHKFRAWNNKTKTMVDLQKITPLALAIDPAVAGGGVGVYIPDHPDIEVMQFTGLKDKNGKEIYEGDVVECKMSFNDGVLPYRGSIVYAETFGAFATQNLGGTTLLHNHIASSFKIIGNIHENPELLKTP